MDAFNQSFVVREEILQAMVLFKFLIVYVEFWLRVFLISPCSAISHSIRSCTDPNTLS